MLTRNTTNLASYLGKIGNFRRPYDKADFIDSDADTENIIINGAVFYQLGTRKEKYMQEFPYLFGQLLSVSDALHEMYCIVVRDNEFPIHWQEVGFI